MFTVNEIFEDVKKIGGDIKKVLDNAKYDSFDDLSGLEDFNDINTEKLFIINELKYILEKFECAENRIEYLKRPIKHEGVLHINSRGRYETNEVEYTSGQRIEYLAFDESREHETWKISSVEHTGKDYYIVGDKNLSMENLRVRKR